LVELVALRRVSAARSGATDPWKRTETRPLNAGESSPRDDCHPWPSG